MSNVRVRVVVCRWTIRKHMSARLAEYCVGTGSYNSFLVTISSLFLSLSLLQVGLDSSGEGSATRVLRLHSALFSTSIRSTRKSSMFYFTTLIHLFLCLSLLHCPRTSASKILLTQSSFSRRCTCPNHLNLASRTFYVMHATPRMRRISSFLFLLNIFTHCIHNDDKQQRTKAGSLMYANFYFKS